MKRIGPKYHIEGDQIIKSTTGETIPDNEPIMIFRGRDRLALPALEYYRRLCKLDGCNDYQMSAVEEIIDLFAAFAEKSPTMKQPGITQGK